MFEKKGRKVYLSDGREVASYNNHHYNAHDQYDTQDNKTKPHHNSWIVGAGIAFMITAGYFAYKVFNETSNMKDSKLDKPSIEKVIQEDTNQKSDFVKNLDELKF